MTVLDTWEELQRHFEKIAQLESSLEEGKRSVAARRDQWLSGNGELEQLQTTEDWIKGLMGSFNDLRADQKDAIMSAASVPRSQEIFSRINALRYDRGAKRSALYSACCSGLKYIKARRAQIAQDAAGAVLSERAGSGQMTIGEVLQDMRDEIALEKDYIARELQTGDFRRMLDLAFRDEDLGREPVSVPTADAETFVPWYLPTDVLLSDLSASIPKAIPDVRSLREPISVSLRCEKEDDAAAREYLLALCLKLLLKMTPVEDRVVFLDGTSHNPGNWTFPSGSELLLPFAREDGKGFVFFARDEEEEKIALEKLKQLNPLNGAASHPHRFLLVYGYPDRISGIAASEIGQLIANSDSRGISVILVSSPKASRDASYSRVNTEFSILLQADGEVYLRRPDGDPVKILLPRLRRSRLDESSMDRLIAAYQQLAQLPPVDFLAMDLLGHAPRRKKPSERFYAKLPFAIDKNTGEVFYAEFDTKEQPYAFFTAPSGAGKTSALHMMISALITQAHPDDVELWLLDMKGVEFTDYRCVPHVRYILSSGSEAVGKRYVLDILDRLESEYLRRSDLCSKYHVQEVRSLPDDCREYIPMLLVVLDEYAIIDGQISGTIEYMNKLQRLLRLGRAMGMFMIFSSQTYDTSAMGDTAANIQTRIGMYSLDSPMGLRFYPADMPRPAIGQKSLPKFHSIYTCKRRSGQVSFYLQHLRFDKGTDLPKVFAHVKKEFSGYRVLDKTTQISLDEHEYVRKAFVFAPKDSSAFQAFAPQLQSANQGVARRLMDGGNTMLLHPGLPCSLANTKSAKLLKQRKENILSVIRVSANSEDPDLDTEAAAAMLKSALLFGAKAEIWTSRESALFLTGDRYRLWEEIPCYFPDTLIRRMTQLKERLGKDERRLVLVLDPNLILEELQLLAQAETRAPAAPQPTESIFGFSAPPAPAPDDEEGLSPIRRMARAAQRSSMPNLDLSGPASPAQDKKPDPLKLLGELLQDGPQNGLHFMLQLKEFEELDRLRDKSDLMTGQIYSIKNFRHVLSADVHENDLRIPYLYQRASLSEGLLFYSCDDTVTIYKPFLFGLPQRAASYIDSTDE